MTMFEAEPALNDKQREILEIEAPRAGYPDADAYLANEPGHALGWLELDDGERARIQDSIVHGIGLLDNEVSDSQRD